MDSACPVCTFGDPRPFLKRGDMPVHQNLVAESREAARAIARGDLDLRVCPACGFVMNAAFDPAKLSYGEYYDNTQTCSPAFAAHVDERVRHLVEARGVRGARVVEVGCGKGDFVRRLVAADAGNRGVGFDPSYTGPLEQLEGRLRFERAYYGPEWSHVAAEAVVCRHVIEHVPDPVALLRAVARPDARVYFETPCVEWILRNRVVWDFFYEHCSYFSAASLRTAFERAGFTVDAVEHVFGGQYLWLEARYVGTVAVTCDAGELPALAHGFAVAEAELLAGLDARLEALRARGPVALWGAAAKGSTLAGLLDPRAERLACVADVNPNKQGRYLPGTGHPIVAPAALAEYGVRTAVLTNPNYMAENRVLLDTLGLAVELVDWMAP